MDTKKRSILFILNGEDSRIKSLLPDICNILVKKYYDVHFIYPAGISEEFEINMRKVPWIHAHKMSVGVGGGLSKLAVPFAIRHYIKKHDGVDVIHSFGLMCGVLAFLGSIGLKIAIINSPDIFKLNAEKTTTIELFKRFICDNISFVFNRLYNKVIFLDEDSKKQSEGHISYRNITSVLADVTTTPAELAGWLEHIYAEAILSKNKNG